MGMFGMCIEPYGPSLHGAFFCVESATMLVDRERGSLPTKRNKQFAVVDTHEMQNIAHRHFAWRYRPRVAVSVQHNI
jgi:hypothetical protein